MCYHVMVTSYHAINTTWLSCDSHVTYPQLTVEVGAVVVTATNLEQNIIFLHSYQKPVSIPQYCCVICMSVTGDSHIIRHCGHKSRANLCRLCDLPPTPFKSWEYRNHFTWVGFDTGAFDPWTWTLDIFICYQSYNFLTTSYFISCEHAAQLYMLRKGWGHMLFDPSYKISAVFEDPWTN